uniref:Uncharacterized protein n=1 Tax=Anguilla anguilla TaxID=7936 RepID=A0A0E9QS82_ANGAN
MVQATGGGVITWGTFSWHTLGLLIPIEHLLYGTVYLNIVADHVHPLYGHVYPFPNGHLQQDEALCQKIPRAISYIPQLQYFVSVFEMLCLPQD